MGSWNNIASRSRSKSDGADPFATGLPIGHDNNPNIPEIIDPKHPLQCTENGLRDEMGLPKRESYRRLCGFHESSVSSRLRVSPKRQALRVPRGLCPLRVALGLLWRFLDLLWRFLGLLWRPWVCSGVPGSARASRRRLLRLSLAALSAMPLLSACGSGGGAKPGTPSSDVASRRSAGAKTPGDRRAIAGSQARALRALRLPVRFRPTIPLSRRM